MVLVLHYAMGQQQGAVQEIHLRTTVLRGLDGTVHVFRNGSISTLSNMTKRFSWR